MPTKPEVLCCLYNTATHYTVQHSDEILSLIGSGISFTDPYYFMDKSGNTLAVVSACKYTKRFMFYVTKSKFTKDLLAAIDSEYIIVDFDTDYDPVLGHQECLSVKYKSDRSRVHGTVAVPTRAPLRRR